LTRSISIAVVGLLLLGCAVGAVAQEPSGWQSPGSWQVLPLDYQAAPPARVNAPLLPTQDALPQTTTPYGTIERLPPVQSYWENPLVTPTSSAVPMAPIDAPPPAAAEQPESLASSQKEGEANKEVDLEEQLDIEGDRLPLMFESVVIERAPWYDLDIPWLDPWEGNFEMGLDGSSGNSNTFNIRLGAEAKRKTKRHRLSLDLDYHKNTNDSIETANRLYFEGRYERLSQRTPWTWFLQQTTDYDEFQPWDVRVVASTGLGYRFLDDEITTLTTRFGGGFSQDVGGPDQDCVPEMNYGIEYEHQMTKRQKIGASVEYFPKVTCFDDFRLVSKADWEVLLDEEMNLSLKVSAIDRYNQPNPGGKLNDVDYSIVLLWSF